MTQSQPLRMDTFGPAEAKQRFQRRGRELPGMDRTGLRWDREPTLSHDPLTESHGLDKLCSMSRGLESRGMAPTGLRLEETHRRSKLHRMEQHGRLESRGFHKEVESRGTERDGLSLATLACLDELLPLRTESLGQSLSEIHSQRVEMALHGMDRCGLRLETEPMRFLHLPTESRGQAVEIRLLQESVTVSLGMERDGLRSDREQTRS